MDVESRICGLQYLPCLRFALCPVGDTPESKRVYDALRAGSVPLLSSKFVPPPLGSWRSFSARIEYNRSSGGVLL